MKKEFLDIYDNYNMDIAEREEVHKKGYWHETFQCWIVKKENEKDFILFQKRQKSKKTFPDKFDITAAGHLIAGEGPEDGIRELTEELGINAAFEDLTHAFVIEQVLYGEDFIDKEYCNVFLYKCDKELKDYKLQLEEVSGLVKIELKDIIKLFNDEIKYVSAEGILLDDYGNKSDVNLDLYKEDFVPHNNGYYEKIFEAAERYLVEGK
ncbi:MAG: NUDIX domain-containing protein [Bacillota bacterium]|nr:NUDIX domain-containing protein [Bacillota bacterium]